MKRIMHKIGLKKGKKTSAKEKIWIKKNGKKKKNWTKKKEKRKQN